MIIDLKPNYHNVTFGELEQNGIIYFLEPLKKEVVRNNFVYQNSAMSHAFLIPLNFHFILFNGKKSFSSNWSCYETIVKKQETSISSRKI